MTCCEMARCRHVVSTEVKHEVRLWKKRESRPESFRQQWRSQGHCFLGGQVASGEGILGGPPPPQLLHGLTPPPLTT